MPRDGRAGILAEDDAGHFFALEVSDELILALIAVEIDLRIHRRIIEYDLSRNLQLRPTPRKNLENSHIAIVTQCDCRCRDTGRILCYKSPVIRMKILFIRGGGLGDFIVTLPTLRVLRERWPDARIELLGQPRQSEIALNRYYVDAVRSANHGPLSAFFMPSAVIDPAWMDYVGGFDLVLSYFYDPDALFRTNLERCGPDRVLTWTPRVPENYGQPAARFFSGILAPLGLGLGAAVAGEIFPSSDDIAAARAFIAGLKPGVRIVAIHPGSGSETKNWPMRLWAELGWRLCEEASDIALLLIEGEADGEAGQFIAQAWKELPHTRARLLPLPILAALLRESALYLGHDTGITHLAAAARRDLPVIALFGPSDPGVWAPPRPGVHVVKGIPSLPELSVEDVFRAALSVLNR